MRDGNLSRRELAPDQTESVAIDGVALRTEERDPSFCALVDNGLKPGCEGGRARHGGIVRRAVSHERRIVGFPAEFAPQEHIGDATLGECRFEPGAIEMRHKARHRFRPHIGNRGYAGPFDERDEPLERVVGMADREDAGARHGLARVSFSGNIEVRSNGLRMRTLLFSLMAAGILFVALPAPIEAQTCTEDYVTVETVHGTIVEIVPAPEPFVSTDIRLSVAAKCTPLWMQVLKSDAAHCQVGDRVEVHGIVIPDFESDAWTINPVAKMYMLLGQDFSCTR